jgi:hypothetical protein
LSVDSVSGAVNGTVRVEGNEVVFTPAVNFHGTASFSYRLSDGLFVSAPATVTVDVAAVDDTGQLSIGLVTGATLDRAPKQGDLLRAVLSDVDGLNSASVSYQWLANGLAIAGAEGESATLTVTQSLVGQLLSVRASYTDGAGTAESPVAVAAGVVASENTAPQLKSGLDPLALSGSLGGAINVSAASRFIDADAGDQLSYTGKLAGGEALPAGLSLDAATGLLSGTLQAGWLGARQVVVTATDRSGASASETWTVQTTAPQSGLYVAGPWVVMSDFGASGVVAQSADEVYRSAAQATQAAGRLGVVFSESLTGGATRGAELNGANLKALLDGNAATGIAPYVSLPVAWSVPTNYQGEGTLTLSARLTVLGSEQQVSAPLQVRWSEQSGAIRLTVKGDQSVPLSLNGQAQGYSLSFSDGALLGTSVATLVLGEGQGRFDLYLLELLNRFGATAGGLLDDYLTGEVSFSVSFEGGLPVRDATGGTISGVDVQVVVADTANRAPVLKLPTVASGAPLVVVPEGSTVGLGGLIGDVLGDVANDRWVVTGNGEPESAATLTVLVGRPTAGVLLRDGVAVEFPLAGASTVPSEYEVLGGQVWLKLPVGELARLAYRAPTDTSGTAGAPERASVALQLMDGRGAKSEPVLLGLGLDGAKVPLALVSEGEGNRLLDLNGDGLVNGDGAIAGLFAGLSGSTARVVDLPDAGLGVLKRRVTGTGGTVSFEPVQVGQSLASTDVLSFEPVTQADALAPLKDSVVLEMVQASGQLAYRRLDVQLSRQGSEALPGEVMLTAVAGVNENETIGSAGRVVATIGLTGEAKSVLWSLSGPDAALFEIDATRTQLVFKPGSSSLDYETKSSYRVRVNADNPGIGLAGSVEASTEFELELGNRVDTLELASDRVTLVDYGAQGETRAVVVAGTTTRIDGRDTLVLDAGASGSGLTLSNLRQLFDGDAQSGVSPTIRFELESLNEVQPGLHTIEVGAKLAGRMMGLELPLRMDFALQVELVRDAVSGALSARLPVQEVELRLSAGGARIGELKLGNLDADVFELRAGTNETPSLELKLWSLLEKAQDNRVELSELGATGTLALGGAVLAAGIGERTLGELVDLARDVTTLPEGLSGATVGRLIELLKGAVTIPQSLKSVSLTQLLELGASVVVPTGVSGSMSLSEFIELGAQWLGASTESRVASVGGIVDLLREAVDLPRSLSGTLTQLKSEVALSTGDQVLVQRVEDLTRAILGTDDVPYAGNLGDRTLSGLLDLIEASEVGQASLGELAGMVDRSFGGYTVPQLLVYASDVVEGLWGELTLGEALAKLGEAVTLPGPLAGLEAVGLGDLLDLGQLVLAVGRVLANAGDVPVLGDLLEGDLTAGVLIGLIRDAVTVDGVVSGRSLADVLEVLDTTFDLDRAFGAGYGVSELVADLRAEEPGLQLAPLIRLAGKALFASEGSLEVTLGLGSLGLHSASGEVLEQMMLKAIAADQPNIAAPLAEPVLSLGQLIDGQQGFALGTYLQQAAQGYVERDADGLAGVWVERPEIGQLFLAGATSPLAQDWNFVSVSQFAGLTFRPPQPTQSGTQDSLGSTEPIPAAEPLPAFISLHFNAVDSRGAIAILQTLLIDSPALFGI